MDDPVTIRGAAIRARWEQHAFERLLARYAVPVTRRPGDRRRWVSQADVDRALAEDARAETIREAMARTGVARHILWDAARAAGHTTVAGRAYRLAPEAWDAALRGL